MRSSDKRRFINRLNENYGLKYNPKFDNVNEENYKFVDIYQTTYNYDYKYYETVKIREALASYSKYMGYPVRGASYINFDGGVAIWCMAHIKVNPWRTYDSWEMDFTNDPENLRRTWRFYRIGSQRVDGDPYNALLDLVGLGMDILELETLPTFIWDYVGRNLLYHTDPKSIAIMPNVAFTNTLHDLVIMANWDYICPFLSSIGY